MQSSLACRYRNTIQSYSIYSYMIFSTVKICTYAISEQVWPSKPVHTLWVWCACKQVSRGKKPPSERLTRGSARKIKSLYLRTYQTRTYTCVMRNVIVAYSLSAARREITLCLNGFPVAVGETYVARTLIHTRRTERASPRKTWTTEHFNISMLVERLRNLSVKH